jgi:hypothetical protein
MTPEQRDDFKVLTGPTILAHPNKVRPSQDAGVAGELRCSLETCNGVVRRRASQDMATGITSGLVVALRGLSGLTTERGLVHDRPAKEDRTVRAITRPRS